MDRCQNSSGRQKGTEDATRVAVREFAEAQELHAKALAAQIKVMRDRDNIPSNVVKDMARGTDEVAALQKDLTLKEGEVEVMKQAGWRRNADRKDAQRFADWSQRREFAEAGNNTTPTYSDPVGGQG